MIATTNVNMQRNKHGFYNVAHYFENLKKTVAHADFSKESLISLLSLDRIECNRI